MGRAIANDAGTLHLHISSEQPEAAELKAHVEGMRAKNVDHASHDVLNPVVSGAQFKAMEAAKHGHSTLGIPAKVGREFVPPGSKKPKGLPARKRK